MTLEKDIEKFLVSLVENAGGRAYKFTSPGNAGVPDRLILLPGGICAFAETKAPGEKMRPLQVKCAERIEELGFPVLCINCKAAAELAVRMLLDPGRRKDLFGFGWREGGFV